MARSMVCTIVTDLRGPSALAVTRKWVAGGLVIGASFVPEEKRSWKPAGTSRSAREILAHATYWNLYFMRLLRGEKTWEMDEETWTRSTKELQDSDQALKLAEKSGKDFVASFEKVAPKDLEKKVELPWGHRTLYQVALDNFWHLTYHVGQLCYIQTMLGDTQDR